MLMFWVLAGALCLATVAALLAVKPPSAATASGSHSEGALAIYKDQLTELDRDVAAGVVTAEEADAQRTEISRRLLSASRENSIAQPSYAFSKFSLLTIPACAAVLYFLVGSYGLPDVPRAERLAAAEISNDWEALIARVELQLEKHPDDVQGWQLLVPNYLNLRRYGDAARAIGNLIRINGPEAELYAAMGEALVYDNKGLMNAQTVSIFKEALKLDPKHPKAQYYNALGLSQEGKAADAKQAFETLLAQSPADAPWRKTVEQEIAKLSPNAAAPQISNEQMQGAEGMAPEERMAMIRGMVDGLDEKLKANPNDIEGWLRLIRARSVLNEQVKSANALATARTIFVGNEVNLKLLDDLANELNMK
jgi:cytochrome c-type biogenesis protein CcmH